MKARLAFVLFLAVPALAVPAWSQTPAARAAAPAEDLSRIVAVVNGDVITAGDVAARRHLLALSIGLANQPEAVQRLTQAVTQQLIDERLRLQEMQRRQIVVSDKDIANAFAELEHRNNMPPGAMRRRLEQDGVQVRTMIDELRVQIGWSRVVREALGPLADITEAEVEEQTKLLLAQTGQTEYHVSQIFLSAPRPNQQADARALAETIITQLRGGAPFPIVAAQFSQSQTALQGGDLGWVEASQLDPEEVRVASEMPPGAISNPLQVPGGISIIALQARRVLGKEMALVARVRQVFFPFTQRLDPNNPNAQQRQALDKARALSASAKSCADMDQAATASGNAGRATDPGEVRVDSLANPALRQMVASIAINKASQPVIAEDGVAVVMVCERGEKNVGLPDKQAVGQQLFSERIELTSRRLMADLQRRAEIRLRS